MELRAEAVEVGQQALHAAAAQQLRRLSRALRSLPARAAGGEPRRWLEGSAEGALKEAL